MGSWGTTWGDKGYIRMAKDISTTGGQCGIAKQPSYPIIGGAPTPTPTPTPPTPTPTPTPSPPGPSTGPYEDPPCASDEQAVQVTGLDGTFCSPKCKGLFVKTCPAAPAGVTAQGKCVLEAHLHQPTVHLSALVIVSALRVPLAKQSRGLDFVCTLSPRWRMLRRWTSTPRLRVSLAG